MTNTMADLRREVAQRVRETLHGREVDTYKKGTPELEHMLGIVPLGAISTDKAETDTLLDSGHRFWQDYYTDIDSRADIESEIETAMRSLKDDGIVRVSAPYGEDAGIMYVEVEDIEKQEAMMTVTCTECGEMIETSPEISHGYGRYSLIFKLDCPECDFSGILENNLVLRKVKE